MHEKDSKTVSVPMLQAALIKRATDDVIRAVTLQTNKQSLNSLVTSGAISQDLLHQFNSAEAELETEMATVQEEAEMLVKGMGAWVFQISSELLGNCRQRELREEVLRMEIENLTLYHKFHQSDAKPTPERVLNTEAGETPLQESGAGSSTMKKRVSNSN
ncbi:Translocation protein sec66 [Zancudomyces culisetae]|uniref:Translocation protein sec66 n=1 Tax=Zancudomyces culisetae TaxID=1213189 RepID=A0A1R1PW80_ZANCU|nr:Translocation protein sec66 [Zancudomyces culisetae]|eukprot:OMH85207.1 Translocation protein sec66 [Zancudomyces culisetae]